MELAIRMKKILFLCVGILLVGVIVYLQLADDASPTTKQFLLKVCMSISEGVVKLYHQARSSLS